MGWERYQSQLQEIDSRGHTRYLKEIQSPTGRVLIHQGLEYLNFSSNNYLGLAQDKRVGAAFIRGIEEYGVGSGAARLINGSLSPFHELEKILAQFKGTESALIFNSGYQANVGILGCLLGEGDIYFSDELNHASIIDGLRLSKAKKVIYPHGDVEELRQQIRKQKLISEKAKLMVVTESVFSMDGDLCPLKELLDLCVEEDVTLYLDEAHATGVFGDSGAGLAEDYREHPACSSHLIQMGTLGKALGCFGAYVAGPQVLIDYLTNRARTFIFATALPPGVATAVLEALKVLKEQSYRRETLWQRMELFEMELKQAFPKIELVVRSPIIPLIVGEEGKTSALSEGLKSRGYWVNGIRPPTVPEGTSRLRITLMATHSEEDIRGLVKVLKEEVQGLT